VATAFQVAQGKDTGLAAYPLLDPAIVGDVAADFSVDAGDVSTLADYVSHLPAPQVPVPPTGLQITAAGPDPTLSLAEPRARQSEEKQRQPLEEPNTSSSSRSLPSSTSVVVSVLLDDAHPIGSTGMTEAILALSFDPSVLSVGRVTLGSIPAQGTGWQLSWQ